MDKPPAPNRPPYPQGLKVAVNGNAQAFGYSILITVTYGIASRAMPSPSLGEQIGFALSAVLAFSLLNIFVAWRVKSAPGKLKSNRVMLVATATDFIAVGAGLGAAIGVNQFSAGFVAWILMPFFAGMMYVLIQGIEFAFGREMHES